MRTRNTIPSGIFVRESFEQVTWCSDQVRRSTGFFTDLHNRYETQQTSNDAIEQEVARRQLRHLAGLHHRGQRSRERSTRAPSRWAHVDLAALFEAAGNPVQRQGNGLRCGHEPFHASKSRSCVRIDAGTGRWHCQSCKQSGDAITFVMALHELSFAAAEVWLIERYGLPQESGARVATVMRQRQQRLPLGVRR